jgi:class 3 adenylate cyclase/tetratricopeptide (TPR) repeat protein
VPPPNGDPCPPSLPPERALPSGRARLGERKQVTVLFADLKGSFELLRDLDPEEARELLDPAVELMMNAVHRYEGTVNQVTGDGIMALFGAPMAHEDHAVRACYAALAMQEAIRTYAQAVRRSRIVDIQMRVGLNSGEVVVRTIGTDPSVGYSAVGQTTHLAARMEQVAEPDRIQLTGHTVRLAEGFIHTRCLGRLAIKGLPEPIEVFELVGARRPRTRVGAAAPRGLTPLVGRGAELRALDEALARVHAGRGEAVALVGAAGVGKSRLVWQFTRTQDPHDWHVLETNAVSYGKIIAYRPLVDLLKGYFRIEEHDDHRVMSAKVRDRLAVLGEPMRQTLAVFLNLLGVPPDDPGWRNTFPADRRLRTIEACRQLFLAESRAKPLLLVFEDLHWIDSETQTVLDTLVGSLPEARILLLVTYRHEYRDPWVARPWHTEIRIDPLSRENAETLVGILLGDDPALGVLKEVLIDRTAGNPFFLEESVRSLAESGSLSGDPGAYRLAAPLTTVQVPSTVQAVLAARIDRLPPAEKHVLQTAAVVGKYAPFAVLREVADVPEEVLRRCLAGLRAAEFLYESSLFPDLEYGFCHALTHEVAYGSLLLGRRRVLHAEIVAAVERLYRDRLPEQAERLAYHAFRGELWEKAVNYLRQAGAKACGLSAYRQAILFLQEALAASTHLESSRDRLLLGVDLRFEIRNALWALGELSRGLDFLRQAQALVDKLGDERRRARLLAHKASNHMVLGDNDGALTCAQEARRIAVALDDFTLQVDTNQFLGVLHNSLGDYRRAIEFLEDNVRMLAGAQCTSRFGQFYGTHTRTWLVWALAALGRLEEAAVHAAEATRIAYLAQHSQNVIAASWAGGVLDCARGRVDAAVHGFERAVALCRATGVSVWLRPSIAMLGHAYVRAGRLGEGLPLLEQAMAPAENNVAVALWEACLGDAYVRAGRHQEGVVRARHALALARERRERGFEAHALKTLADAIAAVGDVTGAEDHYGAAITVAEDLGMLPLLAECHAALGSFQRQAGKEAEAVGHLRWAGRLCERLGIEGGVPA